MSKASTFLPLFWLIIITQILAIITSYYESQYVSSHGSLSHCQSMEFRHCGGDSDLYQTSMTPYLTMPQTDISWEEQKTCVCV